MDISQQKDFNVFINKSTLYLLHLNNDKIHCRKAEEVEDEVEYEKYREHMKSLRKDIFPSPNKNENLAVHDFSYTIDHLGRLQPKKKLFCRYGNHYLVKKSFTEGAQYVKQGETHTYKTIGRPLDIFISNTCIDAKTLRRNYDFCTKSVRINPGETKKIPSNTYYVVIAPCHTVFIKQIENTPESENSTEMSPSFETEAVYQVTNVTLNRNGCSSGVQTNGLDRRGLFPQPSGSRDDGHGNSRLSMEFEMVNDSLGSDTRKSFTENRNACVSSEQANNLDRTSSFSQPSGSRDDGHGNLSRSLALKKLFEVLNDCVSTATKRYSTENDIQSKRAKTSTPDPKASTSQMEDALIPPSPNSVRKQIEPMNSIGLSNDDHGCAVLAIRKDSNIESYALRSDSDFQIHDNIITGSFAIENGDMDPYVFEYHGEEQFIKEVAKFKNGSKFETTLTVQRDLLNELQHSTKKKEKVVVNYFFESAFKTVEAAYKKFSEMRNTKMIGSCVPAIIPLRDARFFGAISDAYEGKP
ncbi:unnamed protein product [Larinioides sclopetarius]|uniref:Uncharacterized protein n=1 Tax=Larinioides sclopetarius TaxID=280406 RepID=A0AAV2B482_9ARAC